MPTNHPFTCNVCEAMCGLSFATEGGRIVRVTGDKEDVFSRGHLCPKGPAMREVLESPDRLRTPLRRTPGGDFEPISFERALDEAGERLNRIRAEHGRDAVGVYIGNPTVHNYGALLALQGFLKALRTKNRFDANSQDANPRLFACMLLYGDQLAVPIPDVDRTDYLLMFGANPAASGGSLMTLGDVRGRLQAIRRRGGRMVLIDPRRSETAELCDEHHFLRPGGDAALLLALLQVIFAGEAGRAVDEAAVGALANGLAEVRALALRYPPERVAEAVGMDAATIRRLAREFMAAPRAAAYGRIGTCQNPFGPVASWLIDVLNVVSGNFDREGGVLFPEPAVDLGMLGRKLVGNHYGRWRSRVRGLPEFAGQLPAAVMAEEIETPGPGQLRALVTIAGNPVLSTPNSARLDAALARLSYMVSVDYYLNETTRHAHLILPPVHALERGHYDVVFHNLAVHNSAKWSEPVVPAPAGALDDFAILYELGMRVGGMRLGAPLLDKLAKGLWRLGYRPAPERILDLLLRVGPHRLSLKRLRAAPHGVDLGPLRPCRARKVRTADGKVQLAPEPLLRDAARLEGWLAEARPALVLIGRRHLRSNNSWMNNLHSLTKGPDRNALLMHPADAAERGLGDGSAVQVAGRAGAVRARLQVSDALMRGVVSLPHGHGHPNCNAVTDELMVEPLLGTAVLNGVPVQVTPAEASQA